MPYFKIAKNSLIDVSLYYFEEYESHHRDTFLSREGPYTFPH